MPEGNGPPGSGLEAPLRARLAAGGRIVVPYVTGGLPGVDPDLLRRLEAAGADAIEVGIPFSDPVMDGPVVQEASRRALAAGATVDLVLATVEEAGLGIPVVLMTYLNPVWVRGFGAFLEAAASRGVSGVVIPDLPVDEAADWTRACAAAGVAPVFLAAPGTAPARLRAIASASRGFVYCVSTYGVTGERDALATTAKELVASLRPLTDLPLLVGVGIATPAQAEEACRFADGVVVGSAIVRRLLQGDPEGAVELTAAFGKAVGVGSSTGPPTRTTEGRPSGPPAR
ncbi:MAG TPA: tryptophan synthase subunit alpha [Actinomycetota bacterium]|nr:tryptophan synthase subunit alpha [Actinomycetota bacterium]